MYGETIDFSKMGRDLGLQPHIPKITRSKLLRVNKLQQKGISLREVKSILQENGEKFETWFAQEYPYATEVSLTQLNQWLGVNKQQKFDESL